MGDAPGIVVVSAAGSVTSVVSPGVTTGPPAPSLVVTGADDESPGVGDAIGVGEAVDIGVGETSGV